jgi:hypothetical protein
MRWDTYMGERKGAHRVSVGKHEGKNNLKDRGIDGQITLGWIFTKCDSRGGGCGVD